MKKNQYQIENTKKEIACMEESGMTQISYDEMVEYLKTHFGLKLSLKLDSVLRYYNTSNENHYLECSVTPVDQTGYGWCNINSKFYHDKDKMKQFQKFRLNYFCVLKSGHILTP